jgi:hypothetical protein
MDETWNDVCTLIIARFDIRLPFGTELNTGLASLTRCKIEQMMMKKGGKGTAIEKELYLVDVPEVESIVPDFTAEMTRLYALWDAVCCCGDSTDCSLYLQSRVPRRPGLRPGPRCWTRQN